MHHLTASKRSLLAAALAAFALALSAGPASAATYIVQLEPGASADAVVGGHITGRLPIIDGVAAELNRGQAAALARDPRVANVTLNARVRSQSTKEKVDASKLASAYPASTLAQYAWNWTTGAGVGVAVIDTGVDGGLPDFRGDDGRSRVVASAVTNPDATTVGDSYGHGTHVAGIIAGNGTRRSADDPTQGQYVGIAPDADIISVKASDEAGNATVLDVIYGLQFVVDHKDDYNIRVVNLSLASTQARSYKTDPLDAAVESAYFHGILPIVAAGNRGHDKDAVDYAPANDPYVLTVGAVDDQGTKSIRDDKWASWSSRGTTQDGFAKPEIAAPGSHIVSTLARGSKFSRMCPSCVVDGRYIAAGGTSMAAPIAAGVAALVLQLHPDWTPDQVKTALIRSGRDLPGPIAEVNALAALPFNGRGGANAGLVPNQLVDAATGDIDYARSTWSRSTWSSAADELRTGWSRSTWSCTCGDAGSGVNTTRSTWSRSTWSTSWGL